MAVTNVKEIILYDNWPGVPNPTLSRPNDGWDGTITACLSAPAYDPGTKIQFHSDSTYTPGMVTICYMRYIEGSDSASDAGDTGDLSDHECVCAHVIATGSDGLDAAAADATERQWWNVSHDTTNTDATLSHSPGGAAVACGDLSTGEYGWFWVGGPCPYLDVTKFDNLTSGAGTDVLTVSVAMGKAISLVDASGNITFGVYDETFASATGYSMAAET